MSGGKYFKRNAEILSETKFGEIRFAENKHMLKQLRQLGYQPGIHLFLLFLVAMGFLTVSTVAAAPPATTRAVNSLFALTATEKITDAPQAIASREENGVSDRSVVSRKTDNPELNEFNVDRKPGEDWETAYYNFLREHRVRPKLIRAKVRQLVQGQPSDLEQGIAVVRAALRAGQVQPWMYEALALAMQMNKMPQAEIERVLMSSADFASSPHQLVFLADYMDRLGNHQRALDLLHEASLRANGLPEAYAKALDLAVYLQDDKAIQWAALGVLGQEWPKEKAGVAVKARRNAESLLARLREEHQDAEADRFALQLKEALQRDVVVKVSWSGDADVDLVVQEPSGSVCSYRQYRTGGGGVLVGDPNGNLERAAGAGYSEVYCCPEAFSGDYRVMLRQVWGRIPAGRVTVDVWNHVNTDKESHFHQVIPLDENSALVTFNLSEGRRKESLADHQIANDITNQVAASQIAVNRAILAQQLNAVSDSGVSLSDKTARQLQQASVIGNRSAFRGRGPVGYQPQITVLPVGVSMQANAVVSADRRYVRITSIPFFSLIKGVVQYNIQNGVTDQGQTDQAFGDLDLDVATGAGGGAGGAAPAGGSLLISVPLLPSVIPTGATNTLVPGIGVVTRVGSLDGGVAVTLSGYNNEVVNPTDFAGLPIQSVSIADGAASAIFQLRPTGNEDAGFSSAITGEATGYGSATVSFTIVNRAAGN